MRYWFTADYHLGHFNIIKYCNRPFTSLYHMNSTIIKNHNERVKLEDIVFMIGDFCFKNSPGGKVGEGVNIKSKKWEEQLNGKIIFLKGNHDSNNSTKTIIHKLAISYCGKEVNLVHKPEHADFNYSINFVGHVHEKWKIKRIRDLKQQNNRHVWTNVDLINIGVDVWNFRPVLFEEIMKRYHSWLKGRNGSINIRWQ